MQWQIRYSPASSNRATKPQKGETIVIGGCPKTLLVSLWHMMESSTSQSMYLDLRLSTIVHMGHSGEYGNGAKLVGKMSKSVMQLISIHF